MALSKRLFSIFSMVEKGSVVADIGCDHGLLSIALIQEDVCSRVYACDLRKGPLSRAQEAISSLHLDHQITTILTNGMDHLPEDVDTIIIAGMGFDTIQGILERNLDKLKNYKRIIIQSNKHVEDVRRWISEHHYTIVQEDIVEEDHFYEVIAFTCSYHDSLNEDEILFGSCIQHPLFPLYWKHHLDKLTNILSKMPSSEPTFLEYTQLKKRIEDKLKSIL